MGLERRRHFAARGRQLLGIEDEFFGAAAARLGAAPDGTSINSNGMAHGLEIRVSCARVQSGHR